jgi:predicted transglutaminase-like cysteine proteinase
MWMPGAAQARGRVLTESAPAAPIVEASPALAPFQHVRFCLRNPTECKSASADRAQIELTAETMELLQRVNRRVNAAIAPIRKNYGSGNAWTIAPAAGDCNDYAVTKRHELVESGLPTKALRLAVVKTGSGLGHLVLVASTSKGDLVLDNLSSVIRPWQDTDYIWLKIQSASDARFWYQIALPSTSMSLVERKLRVASR